MVLEVLLDLKSKQGDVAAVFLHAEMKEGDPPVYVKIPQGFYKDGHVF